MMKRDLERALRQEVSELAGQGSDWLTFASRVGEAIARVIPFGRTCFHPVDPGTYLFTGSLSQNIACSATWLAENEYGQEDVNKWHYLAESGRLAASLIEATHGNPLLSARVRSSREWGLFTGDELRVSFVVDGSYWGGAAFVRDPNEPSFDAEEVGLVASLSPLVAEGLRRALLVPVDEPRPRDDAPAVLLIDERGEVEATSAAAESLIARIIEVPPISHPRESRIVQAVAARARRADPNEPPPRVRVRTSTGEWLLLYATRLSGERGTKIAVVIQPAGSRDTAPLVAQAYGLSERERQVTRLCLEGHSTGVIAEALHLSPYTVQDHLKSIFRKTGTKSRAELVAQIFVEHYLPRFEDVERAPRGWFAQDS